VFSLSLSVPCCRRGIISSLLRSSQPTDIALKQAVCALLLVTLGCATFAGIIAAPCTANDSLRFGDLSGMVDAKHLSYSENIKASTIQIQKNPRNLRALGTRAYCYFMIGGDKNFQQMNQDAERMLSINPECPAALYLRGEALMCLGQFRAALEDFERLSRQDPTNANVYASLGACHTGLKQFSVAVSDYTNAIKYGTKPCPGLYYQRALQYYNQFDVANAKRDVEEGLKSSPNDIWLLFTLARIDVDENNTQKAIADLSKLLQNPRAPKWMFSNRVALYLSTGQYALAVKDCDVMITAKSSLEKAYEYRAEAFMHLKKYRQAIADFESLRASHFGWGGSIPCAECYCAIGQFDHAVDNYSHVIAHERSNVEAYLGRAKMYDKLGKSNLAAQDRLTAARIHDVYANGQARP